MYQTYDPISGACLTSAESGFNLEGILSLVNAAARQYGEKPIWVTDLAWQEEDLVKIAEERGTLVDVVRADFFSRASLIFLGKQHVGRVYWRYTQAGEDASGVSLGLVSQQVFRNLSANLAGVSSASDVSDVLNGTYQYRLANSTGVAIFVWRGYGGDNFTPYTLHDVRGYQLEAFSLDADSIKKGAGVPLTVEVNGDTAFLLSERPLLVRAVPSELSERISLHLQGAVDSVRSSLKRNLESSLAAQKEKAAQALKKWMAEKEASLFAMLKESFLKWLNELLNVEQTKP